MPGRKTCRSAPGRATTRASNTTRLRLTRASNATRRKADSQLRRKAVIFWQPVAVEGVADNPPTIEQMHRRRERWRRRRARQCKERSRHEHGAELVVDTANASAARRAPFSLVVPRRPVRCSRSAHDDVCRSEAGFNDVCRSEGGFKGKRCGMHGPTRVAMAVRGRVRRHHVPRHVERHAAAGTAASQRHVARRQCSHSQPESPHRCREVIEAAGRTAICCTGALIVRAVSVWHDYCWLQAAELLRSSVPMRAVWGAAGGSGAAAIQRTDASGGTTE